MGRDMPAPVVRDFVRRVAIHHGGGRRTFPQRNDLVFMGLRFKPKRLHDVFKSGKSRGVFVHGVIPPGLHGGVGAITGARVVIGGAVATDAARVLPDLAVSVPMKANLREQGRDFLRLLLRELNPNPLSDNLRHAEKKRGFPFQEI